MATGHGFIAAIALSLLVLQNVTHILAMRYSRTRSGDRFTPSTAFVLSEVLKLVISLVMVHKAEGFRKLRTQLSINYMDTLKSAVPALIYTAQNNLLYVAIGNLDVATFQVTYQLKLLTTALFSVWFLRKYLTPGQWMALLVLFIGVAIVEMPTDETKTEASSSQNRLVGLTAVLCCSVFSGLAAVYFEKILKGSVKSLWVRNVELSFASLMVGLVAQLLLQKHLFTEKQYFRGYDWLVAFIILLQSVGGLIVALVVKYASNILKGFACAASVILSCFISVSLLGVQLRPQFLLGAGFVLSSILLYALFQPPTAVPKRTHKHYA